MRNEVKETREDLKKEIDKLPDEMIEAINRIIKERELAFGHPEMLIAKSEFLREALRDKITEYI